MKKPVSREVNGENENGGPSKRKVDSGFVFVDADDDGDESPTRKTSKRARLSDPSRNAFNERLREDAPSPTADRPRKGKGKERAFEPLPVTSPTLSPAKEASFDLDAVQIRNSHLTTKVLELLRMEGIELRDSTVENIGLMIDLESYANAANVRTYENTISRLSKKLDGMEAAAKRFPAMGDPTEVLD